MVPKHIEKPDLDELDRLELARMVTGRLWLAMLAIDVPTSCRSLAVYAHRSGMVSLPALTGSTSPRRDDAVVGGGFSRGQQHCSTRSALLRITGSWLRPERQLLRACVGGAVFGRKNCRGAGRVWGNVMEAAVAAEDTLRLFQAGKVAFRETSGGCVSTEECKTHPQSPSPTIAWRATRPTW